MNISEDTSVCCCLKQLTLLAEDDFCLTFISHLPNSVFGLFGWVFGLQSLIWKNAPCSTYKYLSSVSATAAPWYAEGRGSSTVLGPWWKITFSLPLNYALELFTEILPSLAITIKWQARRCFLLKVQVVIGFPVLWKIQRLRISGLCCLSSLHACFPGELTRCWGTW